MTSAKVEVKFTKIFINNEWVNSVSGKTFPVYDPATGETIVDVQEGDKADIELAVSAAEKAFKLGSKWRTMDASGKGQLLRKVAEFIKRDAKYISALETLDNGKPISQSIDDINAGASSMSYYAGFTDKLHGKTIPVDGDFHTYTRLEPIGVVGQIVPWNAPFVLSCINLAEALAPGNVVILKPAELAPLSTLYLASLFKEAGFPPGVVNVVPGYGATAGSALTYHMKVEKIAFTGSPQVGRLVQEASAKSNLKRVSLELGGKSPVVVSQHCDLDTAVAVCQEACFYNSGQICCAGTRYYVHEDIYEAFIAKSVEAALKRKLGNPFASDTIQGPQISKLQMDKILDMIESGKKQGATLKCGGKRFGTKGYFVEPTIFADVQDDMRIAREEIFGPVMQIFKYKTLDEAIERANDTEYGLAAGIFTKDIEEALQFSNSVRAGTVCVNNYHFALTHAPFGGYKQSGIGRSCGEEGLMEYVEVKTVSIKIPQKNA